MKVKLIFVLAFLLIFAKSRSKRCSSTSFAHQISISYATGHDNGTCLLQPSNLACKTLDYVLKTIMNGTKARNSIKIEIEGQQIVKENYNLTKLKDFALCGKYEHENAEIECEYGKGLVILLSTGIAIEHLLFRHCGSLQQSNDVGHSFFYSGIFISNTVNVSINNCTINNSTGVGITFFDVGGSVMFNNTVLLGNMGNLTNRINFKSETADLVNSGGGLIIEFTYGGGSLPFKASNNKYKFSLCKFIQNDCSWNTHGTHKSQLDPVKQIGNMSNVFGTGGGMGMHIKGSAKNNLVIIEHSEFRNNLADWGGGYFFSFQDQSHNNSVQLHHVLCESNMANFAGGGGRFGFFPNVNFSNVFKLYPNYFNHFDCKYLNNSASWGGGVSVFGTTESPKNTRVQYLTFTNCYLFQNHAIVGSALGLLSNWFDPWKRKRHPMGKGLFYNIKLVNCTIKENFISQANEYFGKSVIGIGAIYSEIAPITMQNVTFSMNNGTALVLDWSYVYIWKHVTFSSNSGSEGGAVALFGRSTIILDENAFLHFTNNSAELRGGAIYARSQGPDLKAFNVRILDRSTCFFSYSKPHLPPDNWTAQVHFENNTAPSKSGKSIYADTLQFCRNYGNLTEALEWRPFHYIPDIVNETLDYEIVTDPVIIKTEKTEWKVFLGENFYPKIDLRDEKNHSVNGLLKLEVIGVELEEQISHYVYVSNGISVIPLVLVSQTQHNNYSINFNSVFTQKIEYKLENIGLISKCHGGYYFNSSKKKCVCLENNLPFGFSRCGGDGKTIYLKKGYWATGYGKHFKTFPCPVGYCECPTAQNRTGVQSETKDECLFVKFKRNEQCKKHRHGNLCGTCQSGFSLAVGEQDCRKCYSNVGILWLILIVAGLTVVVLVIIYFELDFFSGPLNSWLYTYHVIPLLPYSDKYLDKFINFVISLTNGQFDISSGKCFWKDMNVLQKQVLKYLMPVYCLTLLYFINKLLYYFPNLSFNSGHSFHRALVTIVIISYASVLSSTMDILNPILLSDGKLYVYIQADCGYFDTCHLPYAIPALFILFLVVIPFPFIIAFNNSFTKKFRCLRNFITYFEVLESPYRLGRSWFASYYIFCRLVFVLVWMGNPYFQYSRISVYESISVIILTIFVLLQPYTEDNNFFFKVDTIFLSLLCLINSLTYAMTINQDATTVSFFLVLIRIATYIPLLYSVGLLVRYTRQSWVNYMQRRAEGTPLLQ